MRTRLLLAGVAALTALSATAEVTLKDVIGESPLYGYLINEQTNAAKWNKISSNNTTTTVWEDANCQETGTKMLSGWMNKGVF